MPFIGNQPALSYTSFAKQDFTTSATTSYTLDQPVANANELALFINFVRQEPTTAYTASGTSLTLTSATSASDDMYCVFLGKAIQTVNPPSGSVGISQLSATGTPSSSTFLRGDNSWVAAGGANTPAFMVEMQTSGLQDIGYTGVWTKLNFDNEIYDTNSNYDTTNKRFLPTTAGKYKFNLNVGFTPSAGGYTLRQLYIAIYKNGSAVYDARNLNSSNVWNDWSINVSCILSMNGSTDYIEAYARSNGVSSGSTVIKNGIYSNFHGYKIIE